MNVCLFVNILKDVLQAKLQSFVSEKVGNGVITEFNISPE